MFRKLKRNIIVSIILFALIYLLFSLYSDFDNVLRSLSSVSLTTMVLVLLLTSTNFFFRFLKWHYYVRLLNLKASFWDSLLIFLSGLVMSVTPGKFGEVFKSYLLKKIDDIPIPVSAPIVFAERITDFYSVLLLAFIGSLVMGQGMTVIILTALFFILATLLLNNRKMSLAIIKYFERFNFLEKYISKIEESYESSYTMLRIKPLYEMTLLSLLAWLPECLGFYLILNYFSVDVSVLWSVFVYTFSIIVGALTMLPAGIGVTEGSLSYFIFDVTKNMDLAVTVTFLIRISTLWYAVIIGIISLAIIKKKRNIENL